MDRCSRRRLFRLRVVLLVLVTLLSGRLLWMQGFARERYLNPTGIRYTRRTPLPAIKGELRDRNGRVLARLAETASVYANPQMVGRPVEMAAYLAPIIDEPAERLLPQLTKRWRRVRLRGDAPPELVAQLAPLVRQGIVTIGKVGAPTSWSVLATPALSALDDDAFARLAVVLGLSREQLRQVSRAPGDGRVVVEDADAALMEQLKQLDYDGVVLRQNRQTPGQPVYLEPVPQAVELTGRPRIRPEVWQALAPLWAAGQAPEPDALVSRMKVFSVALKRQAPAALGEAIRTRLAAEGVQAVAVLRESAREYPQGALARTLIGGVDRDERGTGGLELTYNHLLSGATGWAELTVDPRGRPILQERVQRQEPRHGYQVELTLDATIQSYAEEAVQTAVNEFDADWGIAVVADPFTGEIVALADVANAARQQRPASRSIGTPYEPGSILKPMVTAAALDEGVTTPTESFYCAGGMAVGGRRLGCIKTHGPETTADAVRDSCNMVMIQLASRLGQARLEPRFAAYGLFNRTGVGLASQEATGAIFNNNTEGRWGLQKTATVSYGKGIQTTAIGVTRAYAAVINGGRLPEFHLIRRLLDRDGRVISETPTTGGKQILSAKTTEQVRAMLRAVVADPEGTGQLAASKLYNLAAKTGTSIGYAGRGARVVSMVGYGPYEHARLVTLVSVSEPRIGSRSGSVTCGAAMRTILDRSLQYLGVPALPGSAAEQAKLLERQAEQRRAREAEAAELRASERLENPR